MVNYGIFSANRNATESPPSLDDESDSSTLSSCDSAQLLRLSPKSNGDDASGAKKSDEKGQNQDEESGNPEPVKEIEIKVVREEDSEKRDSLGRGVVLKKCLSQIDSVSAIHRSSSSSSRLSSSSRWEP